MPCGSFFILLEQTAQIVNYIYRGLWRFFHIKLMWKKVHLVKYSLESWLQSLALCLRSLCQPHCRAEGSVYLLIDESCNICYNLIS